MRNGRSRHKRQSGDRRRRSSSSDRIRPIHSNPPRSDLPLDSGPPFDASHPRPPHAQDFEAREFEAREFEARDRYYGDRYAGDIHPEVPPEPRDRRSADDRSQHYSERPGFPAQSGRQMPDRAPVGRPSRPAHPQRNRPPRDSPQPTEARTRDRTRPSPSERDGRPPAEGPASQRGPSKPPGRQRRKSRSSKPASRKQRKHSSWQAIAFQGFVLSVALGLFCGLIARRWGAALSTLPDASGTTPLPVSSLAPSTFIAPSDPSTRPGSPIDELNQALEALDAEYPNLQLGTVLVDISERNYAGLRAQEAFPAASTIKLAVLAAVLESVDNQEIALTEKLTLQPTAIVEGSGTLDSQAPGAEVSVLAAAEMMISTSDNTATNLLIDRLGGIEVVNQRFLNWGLRHTELINPLPDFGGENTSSPADLALLLGEIERGEILGMISRDRFLDILSTTRNDTLLPQSLQEGDRIAHKTGTINSSLGDVGLIDLPNGERYIAAVMVRRENNDAEAIEVIREVSRLARNYWGQAVLP